MIWIELFGGPFHGQWREVDESVPQRGKLILPTLPSRTSLIPPGDTDRSAEMVKTDTYNIRRRDIPPELPVEWIGVHETLL